MDNNDKNAIWNPNAASNWSLIFTPAFGAYLHALNWETLGEHDKARSAARWFYLSIAMLLVYIFIGLYAKNEEIADGAVRSFALGHLIVWYFSSGRKQGRYVKNKFGKDYPRRRWLPPLFIGCSCIVASYILAFIAGFVFTAITNKASLTTTETTWNDPYSPEGDPQGERARVSHNKQFLFSPDSFYECILQEMPGVQNDITTKAIYMECKNRFPGETEGKKKGQWFAPKTARDCVMHYAKDTPNNAGARIIRRACYELYPE